MKKPSTVFVVTDIETTLKERIAFDVAWKAVDRKGRLYGSGSYIVTEAFQHDVPFFKEKLGFYFQDCFKHLIQPASILEVRSAYNSLVNSLKSQGNRVILTAYNAAFDFKELPKTLEILTGGVYKKWMDSKVELMDIWDYWGQSVPKIYKANKTASGKFFSTSAESAYRWEMNKPDFKERHIAWHDCEIEAEILLKTLSRKKRMPIVNSPSSLKGNVWKDINIRLGVAV